MSGGAVHPPLRVTKHMVPEPIPIGAIFNQPNAVSKEQNPTSRNVRSGVSQHSRQPKAWQDLEIVVQGLHVCILQRQISVKVSTTCLTLYTMTTVEEELDTMSTEIGFMTEEG